VLSDGVDEEDPCVNDGTGLAEALLGLSGFRVLGVSETLDELVVEIETTVDRVACVSCGTWAQPHERMEVSVRDLSCFRKARSAGVAKTALALRR
jgi:hypothetical protein